VHQHFSPFRDNNITEALYPPVASLSTPKFLAQPERHESVSASPSRRVPIR
jgi:hypothetical protein